MQPPTETTPPARGDEADLYRRHHRDLHLAVAHAVNAPRELIEDACQATWTILLQTQPDRYAIVAWLRVVVNRTFVTPTLQRVRGISNGGQILPVRWALSA